MIRESKDKDAVSGLTWDDFKKMNLTQHVSPQALLSPSISLTNWKPTIPYTIQNSGTVFTVCVCKSINVGYLAPLSKYAVCCRDH